MKKRLLSAFLSLIMVFAMLPAVSVMPVQAVNRVSEAEIARLVKQYMDAIKLSGKTCTYYWNKNVTNRSTLEAQLDSFRATGDFKYLAPHLGTSPCSCRGSHERANGCTSNSYRGSSQCRGFVRYFLYYLYGADPFASPGSYSTYTSANASWESIGGLRMGDHVDYKESVLNHPFIFYETSKDGKVKAVHANGQSKRYPCGINFDVVNSLTTEQVKKDYEKGNVTIRRYILPCQHEYEFVNDNKVSCKHCGNVFATPAATGGGKYMDIVKVNSSGTAPAHKTPYGSATVGVRYGKGDTVYVVGSAANAFGNTWYKLSSGEWIVSDYLGTHIHCWAGEGFCTRCVDETLQVVRMDAKTIAVNTKDYSSFPVRFAPYSDSKAYAYPSTKDTKSVTVTGKVINGYDNVWYRLSDGKWVFGDYLNTAVHSGKVTLKTQAVSLNNAPASSKTGAKKLAEIPIGAVIYVYTDESTSSWYSVRYKDHVGFAYKDYITLLDGSKQVEAPASQPEGSGVKDSGSGGGSSSSGPTRVSVQYPTDPAYLAKKVIGETNATLVANILKPSGSKVTACGLRIFSSNGTLLKDHREAISNVGTSTTSFHAWYDIQNELGLTLTPGTDYMYQFYAVVDGVTYEGGRTGFSTAGTAPVEPPPATEEPAPPPGTETTQYNLIFDPTGGTCSTQSKPIVYNTLVGVLPVPARSGYSFVGWFTQQEGGKAINESTLYNVAYDVTVFAHWTPLQYRLIFNSNGGNCQTQSKSIVFDTQMGDLPTATRSGYTFDGWYTAAEGGKKIHEQMRYNAPYDVTVYARWSRASAASAMTDVVADSWYFDAVEYVVSSGLMSGYSANKFGPNDPLNRAMVVQVLYNKEGKPSLSGATHEFSDVPAGQWFNNAVTWGSKRGVVSGFGGGLFKPEDAVTLEQAAVILWNYTGKPTGRGSLNAVGNYNDWAANALSWCVSAGVLDGVPFTHATEYATRAQIAQMLTNYMTSGN